MRGMASLFFSRPGSASSEAPLATSLRNVDDELQRNYLIAKKLRIERRIFSYQIRIAQDRTFQGMG